MKLSFKNKLFLSFFSIIFLCIIAMIMNQILQYQSTKLTDSMLEERAKLSLIQRLINVGIQADADGAWYLMVNDKQVGIHHLSSYRNDTQEIQNQLIKLRENSYTSEEQNDITDFEQKWKKDLQINEQAFNLFEMGDINKSQTLYTQIPFNQTINSLNSYRDHEREIINKQQQAIKYRKSVVFWTNITINISVIVLSIGIAWVVLSKVQLEQYILMQKEFFQNTSHELKTPLMSIRGYAEGILDGTFYDEKIQKALHIIVDESDRLKKIVTEMILLSKLENEHGNFDFENITIESLMHRSIDRINPLLIEKEINLKINFGVNLKTAYVNVDEEKLLQGIINILSNAIRYAKNNIQINITEVRNKIIIEIVDDGPGFPEEILPYVFHRFIKGKDGESGLGLAIARAIIEGCKGQINVSNQSSGGAVVFIYLKKV